MKKHRANPVSPFPPFTVASLHRALLRQRGPDQGSAGKIGTTNQKNRSYLVWVVQCTVYIKCLLFTISSFGWPLDGWPTPLVVLTNGNKHKRNNGTIPVCPDEMGDRLTPTFLFCQHNLHPCNNLTAMGSVAAPHPTPSDPALGSWHDKTSREHKRPITFKVHFAASMQKEYICKGRKLMVLRANFPQQTFLLDGLHCQPWVSPPKKYDAKTLSPHDHAKFLLKIGPVTLNLI